MTREDAISLLSQVNHILVNSNSWLENTHEPLNIAFDMAIKALEQESCEDCISRADALRAAKNEYLRGWHNALCKALSEEYSIHCEEGNFTVIQEETITGLGLSMDCAVGKDVESYMSALPSVTPTQKWTSTSEKLPRKNEFVGNVAKHYLIQDEFGDMQVAAYTNRGWVPIHTIGAFEYDVVAWMPLPKVYEEEKENEV